MAAPAAEEKSAIIADFSLTNRIEIFLFGLKQSEFAMKTYLFYSSDIAVNVYEKKSLSTEDKKQLKSEGFRKMPFETEAADEATAIESMLEHFKANTAALEEFTKDYCIPASIFSLIYIL